MLSRTLLALSLALSLASCRRTDPAACVQRLTLTAQRLAALPAGYTPIELPSRPQLPGVAAGEVVNEPVVVVELTRSGMSLEGRSITGAPELVTRLARLTEASGVANAVTRPVLLALDRDVRASEAMEVICKIGEQRSVHLMVERAGKPAGPTTEPPDWLVKELASLAKLDSADQRARRISSAMLRAAGTCEPMKQELERLGGAGSGDPGTALRAALLHGLEKCACAGADVNALEAVVVHFLSEPPPRYRLLPALVCSGGANQVGLDATATALDLVRVVADQGKARTLEVRIAGSANPNGDPTAQQ